MHVCDFDENRQLINENLDVTTFESEILRLYQFNGYTMRAFLKDHCNLSRGRARANKSGSFDCLKCDRTFSYESGLLRHLENHKASGPADLQKATVIQLFASLIKCMVCGEVFASLKFGQEHFSKAHEDLDFELPDDYTLATISESYMKVMVVSSLLQCEFCNCLFTKFGDLVHHTSLHDPTKGYEFSNCEVGFATPKSLHEHWQSKCVFMEFEVNQDIIISVSWKIENFQLSA